jgi:hypothetical protein
MTSLKRFTGLLATALLAALTSACESTASELRVSTVLSPDAPFSHYRTFVFGFAGGPPEGSQLSPISLDVENRMPALVRAALAREGYSEDVGKADFVIRLGAGTAEVPDEGLQRCSIDDYDCVGRWMHALSVAIDVYDASTGAHVWHGAGDVTRAHLPFDDALLNGIVTKALAALPRRDPRTVTADSASARAAVRDGRSS